jgi:general stress protein CsbA
MKKETDRKFFGWVALAAWALLIVAGIVAKRSYDHPDWMVFFHLPAAVMLVVGFNIVSKDLRLRYRQDVRRRPLGLTKTRR